MNTTAKLPALYVPHGGGPWPFVDLGFDKAELAALTDYLVGLGRYQPKALLVVSAHWEASKPTVTTSGQPGLLYDYYGFPPEAYRITWPVPGEPALASRVCALLGDSGIQTDRDNNRGLDHGTFIPLKLAFPNADIPTVQLSLQAGLNAKVHIAIGKALAPLRDEGVLMVGSGMSYHNMRGFQDARAGAHAEAFDTWLRESVVRDDVEARLIDWQNAPSARDVHPRAEHLLPLMVIAGARGSDQGRVAWNGPVFGKRVSAVHFG